MLPDASILDRFTRDLDALIGLDGRIGVATSGGPDSLALLLLASAARPGRIFCATVDHALRNGSADEAKAVAHICAKLGIPHATLRAEWPDQPTSAIQERARVERYRLLEVWAMSLDLDAVMVAHHLDDQAETLLMRLSRGAGVRGLAGMRPVSTMPGTRRLLLRPLLRWRRSELVRICAAASLSPLADPSNTDTKFERVRVRNELADAAWLPPETLAASAEHLGDADEALEWASRLEWSRAVTNGGAEIVYRPSDAPSEIRRRIVQAAVTRLASEGATPDLRGKELERLFSALSEGRQATVRGVCCAGGSEWHFTRAPARRPR